MGGSFHEILENHQTWNPTMGMLLSNISISRSARLGQLSQEMLQPMLQHLQQHMAQIQHKPPLMDPIQQPQLVEEEVAALEDPWMFVFPFAQKNQLRSTKSVSSNVLLIVHKNLYYLSQ